MVQSPSPLRHVGRFPAAAKFGCLFVFVVNLVVEEVISFPHCLTMPGSHCCVKNCSSTSHDTNGKHRNNGIQFLGYRSKKKKTPDCLVGCNKKKGLCVTSFNLTPVSMRVCSLHFHSGTFSKICLCCCLLKLRSVGYLTLMLLQTLKCILNCCPATAESLITFQRLVAFKLLHCVVTYTKNKIIHNVHICVWR